MTDSLAELQRLATEANALQERYDFVLAACRDAQALASHYGWALSEIAGMDADGKRADDLGRAARVARNALLGIAQAFAKNPSPARPLLTDEDWQAIAERHDLFISGRLKATIEERIRLRLARGALAALREALGEKP